MFIAKRSAAHNAGRQPGRQPVIPEGRLLRPIAPGLAATGGALCVLWPVSGSRPRRVWAQTPPTTTDNASVVVHVVLRTQLHKAGGEKRRAVWCLGRRRHWLLATTSNSWLRTLRVKRET